jgi:hypothetical protein
MGRPPGGRIAIARRRSRSGITYPSILLIGLGFLVSPAVKALGIGFMGMDMPVMPLTVAAAHLVYGGILGILTRRWVHDGSPRNGRPRSPQFGHGEAASSASRGPADAPGSP